MKNISTEQLTEFVEWYFLHFSCEETDKVCFLVSMEGFLHIGERQAKTCLSRCKEQGLIICRNGIVRKGGHNNDK